MKKRVHQILPWVVAAAIFYYLFQKIPPANVLKTMADSNIPLFLFYAVAYFAVIVLIDCAGLKWLIGRFAAPISLWETILMRGATYLLMIINYNLAQGGMAFYLKRTHKAPVFKTLGTIFYLTAIDLTLVLSFAVLATLTSDPVYRGIHLRHFVLKFALFFYPLFFLWCFFWKNTDHPLVGLLRRFKPLEWFLHRDLFVTFKTSKWSDLAKTFLLRVPTTLLVVLSALLWIHGFRSWVPLSDILIYLPVILIVGTLPITPAGIGTVQALCIEFLSKNLNSPLVISNQHSAEEIILAASLLWVFCNVILKIIFGLYCLTKKSRALFRETESLQR